MKSLFNTQLSGNFKYEDHFDPQLCYNVGVIGSRFSGKTTLLESVYEDLVNDADITYFFCGNPQAKIYKFIKDKRFLFEEYNSDILTDMRYLQRRLDNLLKINYIFDDSSSRKGNKYDSEIATTNITGRNFNATLWFLTQAATYIDKSNRANLDYVFLLKMNTDEEMETTVFKFLRGIIKPPEYIKSNKEKDNFIKQWFIENTQDHNMVFVNLRTMKVYRHKVDLKNKEKKQPVDQDK